MTGHDVMAGYSVIALVTLAALIQYFLMGLNVGRARGRLNVPAPATQGHPEFERLYRVQLNTLEWLVIYLPSLWMFAHFYDVRIAAALGVVWILGRILYMTGYTKEASKRGPGFGIQFLATAILLIGALIGGVMQLAHGG